MAAPTTSWNLVRVYGTWHTQGGQLKPGKYTVTIPARITNHTDDAIIPAGTYDSGDLQTAVPESPSLDIMVPCNDDPDNDQAGWQPVITVSFTDGSTKETYQIDVPYADRPVADGGTGNGVNLRTVALPQQLPQSVTLYKVGVPNGLAQLDSDGLVVNADGSHPAGGGSDGGPVTSADITDATAVGKAVLTAADAASARSAIGAGISNLALGTTSSTAKAGNYQPTAANISDATTVGRSVLTAANAGAARTAIGAGTSSFDGAYSSLTGAPDLTGKMDQSVATGHEARFRGIYAAAADLDGLSDAQDGDWAIVPVTDA